MSKIIIVAVFAALAVVYANPGNRCGIEVTSTCPTRETCPIDKPICGAKKVLDKSSEGCCCRNTNACTGKHEVFGCGCRDTICNEPDIVCIRCQDGCFCEAGYVREKVNGKCIPAGTCPAPKCSRPNEVYNCKCADSVCNQPDKICKRCLDGCHCKDGYVRDVEGGACIPLNSCPAPQCAGANEEFYCKCADSVCNQPDIQCIRCEDKCHCKEGYVREKVNGKCIPSGTCPAAS